MARIQKAIKNIVLGVALYITAALSNGCSITPMYDFGNEREVLRFENRTEISDRVQAYGRLELRGETDSQISMESFGARGHLEYNLTERVHLAGIYVAKPGEDLPFVGVGYSKKLNPNTFARARVSVNTSNGEVELEGFLKYDRKRGTAMLVLRYYPETDSIYGEIIGKLKAGKVAPMAQLAFTGDVDNNDVKVSIGLETRF